ncbi:MAG: hypothetical protein V1870_05205 [Candidatus Aenigmatarchaeota archaeon]
MDQIKNLRTKVRISTHENILPEDETFEAYHTALRQKAVEFEQKHQYWQACQILYGLAKLFEEQHEETNPSFATAYKKQADARWRIYRQSSSFKKAGPDIAKQVDETLEAYKRTLE